MVFYKYFLTDASKEEGGVALKLCTKYGALITVEERELTRKHKGDLVHGFTAYIRDLSSKETGTRDDGWPKAWNNTYEDFDLVITNNDVVSPPEVDTYYVLPPGSSTVIDLSDYIANKPIYKQRPLKFDFVYEMAGDEYLEYFSDILEAYHGKRLQIVLDNDPEWCYEGRATISDLKRKLSICSFTMTVECDPYRYKHDTKTHAIDKLNKKL